MTPYRDIDKLNPEGMADIVVSQDDSALQAGISPSVGVWICYVELSDGDGEDLVSGFWDDSADCFPVGIGKDGGHGAERRW